MVFRKQREEIMNFMEIVQIVEEANTLLQELKADGTLAKIEQAALAVEEELKHPSAQALLAKLKGLKLPV